MSGPHRAAGTRTHAYVAALVATLLWGTQGPVAKLMVTDTTFLLVGALRGVAAAVVLVLFLGWRQGWKAFALPRGDLAQVIALGIIGLGVCQATWLYALTRIPVSITAILTNTAPLFVGLLAVLWLREPLRRTAILGLVLSFAGVILLIARGGGPVGALDLGGVVAALLSGPAWAVYIVGGRNLLARYDPTRIVALTALVGALCLAPLALIVQPLSAVIATPMLVAGGIYLGVIPVAFGYVLWYTALRRLRAVQTAVVQYTIPIWTVIIAAVWLGEPITPALLVGMALVIAGVWIVQRP